MIRRPPGSQLLDTLFHYPPMFRSHMAARAWRNSRTRLAPLFGNEGAFMRGGILLAREIVVNATIVPATGLTIPPHPCSGFRSVNALQDQLQHDLAAEERQHQHHHRPKTPPHSDQPAPTAPPDPHQQSTQPQPHKDTGHGTVP